MQVYPNPAADELFIAVDEPLEIGNIYSHQFLSILQRIENLQSKWKALHLFGLGDFASEAYYVQVQSNDGNAVSIPLVIYWKFVVKFCPAQMVIHLKSQAFDR